MFSRGARHVLLCLPTLLAQAVAGSVRIGGRGARFVNNTATVRQGKAVGGGLCLDIFGFVALKLAEDKGVAIDMSGFVFSGCKAFVEPKDVGSVVLSADGEGCTAFTAGVCKACRDAKNAARTANQRACRCRPGFFDADRATDSDGLLCLALDFMTLKKQALFAGGGGLALILPVYGRVSTTLQGAIFRHNSADASLPTLPVNMKETEVAGVGKKGGICTCPNGQVYQVGEAKAGSCTLKAADALRLACYGGESGKCSSRNPHPGARARVICNVAGASTATGGGLLMITMRQENEQTGPQLNLRDRGGFFNEQATTGVQKKYYGNSIASWFWKRKVDEGGSQYRITYHDFATTTVPASFIGFRATFEFTDQVCLSVFFRACGRSFFRFFDQCIGRSAVGRSVDRSFAAG